MLGALVKGIGSGLGSAVKGIAGATADTIGLSDFTSATGVEKPTDKPKAAKVKAFDEDESPTKVLQRILTEVQTIHKVMASQVVPPSEEEEIQRDKDIKDQEVLDALEDLKPKEDKGKKKKTPWWKMLWAWIQPFIKWISKPLSWIKSLLKLPFFMALKTFAVVLGRFLLFNPVGIALLTIGIIAINWRDIKKAIKRYVGNIKGWIKKALTSIGLGHLVETDEETEARKAEEAAAALASQIEQVEDSDESATTVPRDDQGMPIPYDFEAVPANSAFQPVTEDQPYDDLPTVPMSGESSSDGAAFAGWFKGGGMIPKGKEGIAGEAGPESVRGQLLGGPTIVKGPARVKREGDLDRDLAMKEGSVGTASAADVDYQPRAILERYQDINLARDGHYPGSDFYHTVQERKASSAIQGAGNDAYGNIDMGDDIEFEAATPRQERTLFRQYMRDEFMSVLGATYALAIPAIYPRIRKAIEAEQAEGNIPTPMKHAISQEKYSKTYNEMGKAGKLDWWTGREGKQEEYRESTEAGYQFTRFGTWQLMGGVGVDKDGESSTEYIDMAMGRSYNRGGKDEVGLDPEYGRTAGLSTGHNLLSDYIDVDSKTGEVEISGESYAKGKRSSYGKYTAKKVKKATAHLATGETKFGFVGGKGQQLLSGWGAAKKAMGDAATVTADEKEFYKSLGMGIPGEYKESERTIFGMPYVDENQKRIQATGAMGTLNIINSSNTQNISTASSTSKQNNVGQTQQSISISNRHM